jgi:class 3 adenylate cyclase
VGQANSKELQAGRDATQRFAWREAVESLGRAEEGGEDLAAEDLEALGEAAWWTGSLDGCISARERAYAAYLADDNTRRAAIVAIALTKDYFGKGSGTMGKAWMQRAERLLATEDDCVEHGYMARMRSVFALEGMHDFPASLEEAKRAYETAERFGDRDLLAVSLHDQGRALVAMGEIDEGWALMDEATIAAVSGELSPFWTGAVFCNTITICKELGEYRRAGEWSDAAKRWCDRQSIAGFPGMCRVYRAGVMFVSGAWPDAEREARAACEELKSFNRGYLAEAFYEIGDIRMHVGDDGAAEEAFKQAHELGREPQPGLAMLRLRQGNIESAQASIERALADETTELGRARLLPAFVGIALAAAQLELAAKASEELSGIAERFGTASLRAASASSRGLVSLASGDTGGAQRELRAARKTWEEAGAPYEAARARLALARTYALAGDTDAATMEARAAVAVFERLGATPDVREAVETVGAERVAPAIADREQKTFMFTDIIRSTDLVQAIGDDAWLNLVRWHDHALRALFATHAGHEVDHAGDGFFVAFDDAASALECAVAIQRGLRDHRREHGFAPQVRIGLHWADAIHTDGGYKGQGVHEAARIAALAQGGEILVSRETVSEEGFRFALSEPRSVELKGVSTPVEIVTVDWS